MKTQHLTKEIRQSNGSGSVTYLQKNKSDFIQPCYNVDLHNRFAHHLSKIFVHPEKSVIQAKLSVNTPGDKYEEVADAVANKIINQPYHDSGKSESGKDKNANRNQIQQKPLLSGISTIIHTIEDTSEKPVSPVLNNKIAATQGKGNSMDSYTQPLMTNRFGVDFSNIKIHTDNEAAGMNSELGARAFTTGNDVYFNTGEYQPGSAKGDHLLAHELTHVIQQSGGSKRIQKEVPDPQIAVAAEAKKKADLITKIKTSGIIAVEDADATFTSAELDLVVKAITGLPVPDKASIKGAKIIRVTSLGPTTGGKYSNTQGYDETSATDEQKIELSDRAFGALSAAESIRLITHEIGHAIATMPYRLAMSDEVKAGAKSNKLVDEANVASDKFNAANDENNIAIEESNAAIVALDEANKGADKAAIATAKADLAKKKAAMTKLTAARTAKETVYNTKKAASDAQKLVVTAKEAATKAKLANIDDLKTDAAAKLTAMEGAYTAAGSIITMDNAESADYRASLTATENAIKTFYDENALVDVKEVVADAAKSVVDSAITDRNNKRDALNKLNPKNKVTSATTALESAQDVFFKAATVVTFNKSMNLSVRKFYDVVIGNGIPPSLTKYAAENWPHKPEEFYAEAYSFFITKPRDLETYSKVLYDWFKAGSYK